VEEQTCCTPGRINLFGAGGVERSGRRMKNKGNGSLGELYAMCKEYKKETSKFLTHKGWVLLCSDCRPRAEITRAILKKSEKPLAERQRCLV
jgi:hypothetical protein